jgi:hypothetical protein|mmetsp:Transcript_37350/g.80431  ORF Transcript_37350/g.80431 Transcript_37350/m.80431 type:complete len:83 (+) Transcript_37350:53-301(+)
MVPMGSHTAIEEAFTEKDLYILPRCTSCWTTRQYLPEPLVIVVDADPGVGTRLQDRAPTLTIVENMNLSETTDSFIDHCSHS